MKENKSTKAASVNRDLLNESQFNDCYLTEQEAAHFLRRSRVSLWRHRRDGVLPYSKYSGKIIYKRSDLEYFINKNYVGIDSS